MQKVCYKMAIDTWTDLEEQCPVNVERIINHANNFNAHVGVRISMANLNRAKRSLIDARGDLDLMVTTLNQLLYDRNILKNPVDEVLHMWLMDNLGRLMRKIDKKEEDLLIVHDNPNSMKSIVGVSKISSYAKLLKITSQSVIFESLTKATEEYNNLVEGREVISPAGKVVEKRLVPDEKKKGKFKEIEIEKDVPENVVEIKKDPRTFLYILFHILQVTLFTLGSLSRSKDSPSTLTKKESINNVPSSWRNLLSREGQKDIGTAHKEETGVSVNIPVELQKQEEDLEVFHDETFQEGEEEGEGEDDDDDEEGEEGK